MSEIPTLAIYTHRHHPEFLATCLGSIGRTVRQSCNTLLWLQPASVHKNMADALDAAGDARYFAWVDEDIEFLDVDWLPELLRNLQENPRLGGVSIEQVKDFDLKCQYEQFAESNPLSTRESNLAVVPWLPAHLLLIDRSRVKKARPDVNVPGTKGMSDLDLCLQIRLLDGLDVAINRNVVCYHPHKPADDSWRRAEKNPTWSEEQVIYPQQVAYMVEKWGSDFVSMFTGFNEFMYQRVREEFDRLGLEWPKEWKCHA